MTEKKRDKVIRVENLIIRAKNVKVVEEGRDRDKDWDHDRRRRDLWNFFWGRPRSLENREIESMEMEANQTQEET